VKRALCRFAAETIVLASHEKLGAASPYIVVSLGEIDAILVEAATAEAALAPLRERGAMIMVA
jgi:DeoR/GlpR family transcriptional regulator of sugar metabolism